MSLSEKSDEELSKLLSKNGIKHGPIVDSTRKLYEKKLEKAMEKAPGEEPSSDKTYYREEAEEITYVTYHNPVRQEVYSDMLKRRGNVEPDEEEESDQDTKPPIQITYRTANHSAAARSRELERKSGGSKWKVLRLLLLLAVLAAVFYYAYCRVINNEENPFGMQ